MLLLQQNPFVEGGLSNNHANGSYPRERVLCKTESFFYIACTNSQQTFTVIKDLNTYFIVV